MSLYIYTLDLKDQAKYYEIADISVSANDWEQAKTRLIGIWKTQYHNSNTGVGLGKDINQDIEILKNIKDDDKRVTRQDVTSFYLESTY